MLVAEAGARERLQKKTLILEGVIYFIFDQL
jgi:hypothetical protein